MFEHINQQVISLQREMRNVFFWQIRLNKCETKILASKNFDVNNITFSQYKNYTTGKTAVWITPQGSSLQCSDTYPAGIISDSDITEQSGVLDMVQKGTVVLTDKGFGITELCL